MTKEMVIAIAEKNNNGYWETKEGKVVVEIYYGDNEEIVNALDDNAKIVGGGAGYAVYELEDGTKAEIDWMED